MNDCGPEPHAATGADPAYRAWQACLADRPGWLYDSTHVLLLIGVGVLVVIAVAAALIVRSGQAVPEQEVDR